jgi:hypothetical protein
MKRSAVVTLGLVPALAAATCSQSPPPPDPCAPATYSAQACQYAVDHQGYYHDGTFYRHSYGLPFIYYNNGYSRFLSSGGVATPVPAEHFSPSFRSGSAGSVAGATGGTVRGGFGSSGAAHAGGAGA